MNAPYLTPSAKRDLRKIWRYIARDSVRNADRVRDEILKTCEMVAVNPVLGHSRIDVANQGVRFQAVDWYRNYSIAYVEGSEPLRVLRIFHGARDVPKLFHGQALN